LIQEYLDICTEKQDKNTEEEFHAIQSLKPKPLTLLFLLQHKHCPFFLEMHI